MLRPCQSPALGKLAIFSSARHYFWQISVVVRMTLSRTVCASITGTHCSVEAVNVLAAVCYSGISIVSSPPLSIIGLYGGDSGRAARGHCGDLLSFFRRAHWLALIVFWPEHVTLDRAKNSNQSQHTTLPLFHHHHYHQAAAAVEPWRWRMCRLWCTIKDVTWRVIAFALLVICVPSLSRCCRADDAAPSPTLHDVISHLYAFHQKTVNNTADPNLWSTLVLMFYENLYSP